MIRIAIAAPSAVARGGLESLAASHPEWQIVGALPDLAGIDDLKPDVILAAMDLDEFLSAGADRNLPVVLLTNDPQPVWSAEALRGGVRALLARDASQREILAAVEAAAEDLAVVSPADLETWLPSAARREIDPADNGTLTPRELEVLRMLAEGSANKTIAWKLGVSEHTVKFHVASILAKLGAGSRTEAVTLGVRKGLLML